MARAHDMIMNVGLLLILMIALAYIMIQPLFVKGPYLKIVRERYGKIFGESWSRRKNILFELVVAAIVICLVTILTYLANK